MSERVNLSKASPDLYKSMAEMDQLAVRAALEAALPVLRTSLAENGIQLSQSSVSSESFAGQQQSSSQQHQASRSGHNGGFNEESEELLPTPAALQSAARMGLSPYPLLLAVSVGTSMCFASPFSTPPNALVMPAGKYTFMDYVKVGVPLQVIMGLVMVVVIPLFFPFVKA